MFTKGQQVTFLQNYDSKGTVRIIDLVVYSCGKKQMVLVDEAGQKFEGRHFYPSETQHSYSRVVARLTGDDAVAAALALGAEVVAGERGRMEKMIAHYGYGEQAGYTKAMRRNLAALHEPRAVEGKHPHLVVRGTAPVTVPSDEIGAGDGSPPNRGITQMTKTYYSLIERDDAASPWHVQFGDWDRDNVRSERDLYIESGARASNLKVIETNGRQAAIDARVADLNLALSNYDATPITELAPFFKQGA